MVVLAAVRPVVVMAGRGGRRQGDGDMLWLLFPLLFDFDWRDEGRFGGWCPVTMGNSMEVPQKIKNRTTI